jgi:hypothetical protein
LKPLNTRTFWQWKKRKSFIWEREESFLKLGFTIWGAFFSFFGPKIGRTYEKTI